LYISYSLLNPGVVYGSFTVQILVFWLLVMSSGKNSVEHPHELRVTLSAQWKGSTSEGIVQCNTEKTLEKDGRKCTCWTRNCPLLSA
jgi:hypothetical protein